jgi:Uma2 family endonuclease
MAAKPKLHRFTVDEYDRMGQVGILTEDDRVELIDGEIVEMPPVGDRHAHCVRLAMLRFAPSAVAGRITVAVQDPLRLSDHSEPVPDLLILRPRADAYPTHPTPSDVLLLIEVADSSLAYDQRVKLPLYAREGVPEVWLVELTRRLIAVHREPSSTGYAVTLAVRPGEHIAPVALPDLSLAVADLLG